MAGVLFSFKPDRDFLGNPEAGILPRWEAVKLKRIIIKYTADTARASEKEKLTKTADKKLNWISRNKDLSYSINHVFNGLRSLSGKYILRKYYLLVFQ